ncbi:MAG: hypothetical protein AAB403_09860 [Planctomycetota bacterium]
MARRTFQAIGVALVSVVATVLLTKYLERQPAVDVSGTLVVYYEPDPPMEDSEVVVAGRAFTDLVVSNTGSRLAKNVRLYFTSDVSASINGAPTTQPNQHLLLGDLQPGTQLRVRTWGSGFRVLGLFSPYVAAFHDDGNGSVELRTVPSSFASLLPTAVLYINGVLMVGLMAFLSVLAYRNRELTIVIHGKGTKAIAVRED